MKRRIRIPLALSFAFVACGPHKPAHVEAEAQLLGSASAGNEAQSCVSSTAPITDVGIGMVRIGADAADLLRVCKVVRDSVELDAEAMDQRVLWVDTGDTEPIRALIADHGTVWRIEVASPKYRTADSLGVGTTLRHFLAQSDLQALGADRRIYLLSRQHCGLSFRLDYVPPISGYRDNWDSAAVRELPHSSKVDQVLVVGCEEDSAPAAVITPRGPTINSG